MTSHTIKAESGRQVNVRPSRVRPGLVEITIINSCREVLASCTLDPSSADVFGRAASMEALAIEAMVGEFTTELDGKQISCACPLDRCLYHADSVCRQSYTARQGRAELLVMADREGVQ